jgi:uncharacterized lipoprotein
MSTCRLLAVVLLVASLAACGGNKPKEVDCEKELQFQNRELGKRIVAPEGMDQLDEFAEMPIPKADPDAAPHPGGACADEPPRINVDK